jgi:hydrogenase expression/formation protein HypC
MTAYSPAAEVCSGGHCVTCSDEAIAMTIVKLDPRRGLALCADDDGARQAVETALVDPVEIGETVLVHAGVAIALEAAS